MSKKRPLGPKPVSPIVAVAQNLKSKGYDPIPLRSGKATPPEAWPVMPNTPEEIAGWGGHTVALRMNGHDDLFAIDMDIQLQEVLDDILLRYTARWPMFVKDCVIRHSGAVKVMLIGRLATDKKHMYSARYGVTEEHKGGNRVELFTANDARYIAVWGLHSKERDYGYDGPELQDVEIADLPEFLDDDLNELLSIANEVMEAAGLAKAEDGGADLDETHFDLEPTMLAELKDGRTVTLEALESEAHGQFVYLHGRIFDPGSDSFRVKAKVTPGRGLTLWDFGTGITHCWKTLGPQMAVLAPLLRLVGGTSMAGAGAGGAPQGATMFRSAIGAQAKAASQTMSDEAPPYPPDGADFNERLLWLLRSYGYCALTDTVVDIFEPGAECQLKPAAFERRFAAWYREEPLRGGGVRRIPATTDWEITEHRLHIGGVRLRPDRDFPYFKEVGRLWKNTYQPPRHVGAGDIEPWLRFMAHLLPNKVEREWFCDWLAHKYRNPGVPGVAVIMVACDGNGPVYGTGRGFLRDIISRLLGAKYVCPLDFDVLTGKSAQAVYTDWGAYALLVTVSESKDTAESGRWSERRAVYERLKELVEPRAVERTFHVKGSPAFRALCFASFLIASNNRDSVQVPKDDRRFTALANGLKMLAAMAVELTAWMEDAGNIAELARWLEARDLSGFDAYEPLVTATKTTMQELALSEQDEWFMAARKAFPRHHLFTAAEIMATVLTEAGPEAARGEDFRRWVQRRIRTEARSFDGDFRTTSGRVRIMHWRDYDGPTMADGPAANEAYLRCVEERKNKGFTVVQGGLDATSKQALKDLEERSRVQPKSGRDPSTEGKT